MLTLSVTFASANTHGLRPARLRTGAPPPAHLAPPTYPPRLALQPRPRDSRRVSPPAQTGHDRFLVLGLPKKESGADVVAVLIVLNAPKMKRGVNVVAMLLLRSTFFASFFMVNVGALAVPTRTH